MIWIIIIVIIGYVLFNFLNDLSKDNYDLRHQSLNEKFSIIVHSINEAAFNGQGDVIILNKRSFNLYEDGQNQIINFQYGTGILTITWKYKYFQKQIVHEQTFSNVRNLSIFQQQKIAEKIILEMILVVENHKKKVLEEI